jgi:hypothetical protein
MRRRLVLIRKSARDLAQAPAGDVFGSDSLNDVGRDSCSTPSRGVRLCLLASCATVFGDHTLELVNGNQLRAPRHLDRLDQREDATVEGRPADPECRCRLRSRVGEPLGPGRLSNHPGRRGGPTSSRRMSLLLLASASQAAARHPYNVHEL